MITVYTWVQNLIICFCLLELFGHLVRSEEYRRYVRFFGGLVILLLAFKPVGTFFAVGDVFDTALRQAFVRQDAYELQAAQEALAELQNQKISEAYRDELQRQIREIIRSNGRQSSSVRVTMEDEAGNPLRIAEISIVLMPLNENLNVFETEADDTKLQVAVDAIRTEISSMYGIERRAVKISVKR